MVQQTSQKHQPTPLAANLGLERPPAIYLIAILMGVVLHFVWPVRFVPNLARPVGGLIVIFAAAFFVWSIRTFPSAGTPVPGNQPTAAIVKVGPYRLSGNPYLSRVLALSDGNSAWGQRRMDSDQSAAGDSDNLVRRHTP